MGLVLARGMFMSANAPIRISLGSLVEFLDAQGEKDTQARLDALISTNPDIFAVEAVDDERYLVTTRDGHAPRMSRPEARHTFASRFHTPLPKPEGLAPRPRPRQEPAQVDVLAEITD